MENALSFQIIARKPAQQVRQGQIAEKASVCSSKTYENLPLQLRLPTTSSSEQRVPVLVPNEQGLHLTTQFLLQEYLNLVA